MSIGLDIGFHSIKVVELTPKSGGFEISNFAVREIPASVLQQKDRADAMAGVVRNMFSESGVKGRQVYLLVSGHNVVIRNAMLPKMPMEELAEAVKWNAKEEVMFDMEGAAVDYHIMGEKEEDGARFNDLLTVIVRKDVIPFMISIAQKAGLQVLGVTVVPLALWDYDAALNPQKPGIVTSYVDMGSERTRIYFVCDNQLLFSREVPNGGKNLTAALEGEYILETGDAVTVDHIRAEEIKKAHGLPAENAVGTTRENIPLSMIRDHILPVVEKQVTEFERSIEYFKNQYKKDAVHRLILSGGGVGLKGLYAFIKETLEIDIDRCNALFQGTLQKLELEKEEMKLIGPSLTAAAGLALGKCDKINVLPELYRPSFKKNLVKLIPFAAGVLLVSAVAAFSLHIRGNIEEKEAMVKTRQAQMTQAQEKIAALQKPQAELERLTRQESTLAKEKKQFPAKTVFPIDFPEAMDELVRLTARNTSYSEMTYATGGSSTEESTQDKSGAQRINIRGQIFGDELDTQNTLRDLLEDLNRSSVFTDIKLVRSRSLGEEDYTSPGIQFELYLYPELRKGGV
ncbi:hypothetical protein UZ36_05995 [Candidatus Nitromaritima sp. SCGC AAA799-C22]|nr:hypothetical protein UZ36_05995 [Candidatus Nitromaritima sp. SCGC AAA799-C22]